MNSNPNLKLFPTLQAAMHAKTAFALAFTIATQEELLAACIEDQTAEITINISELADILASVTTLATLCYKHNLLDLGAIESVWAEHMGETALRRLSKRFTMLAEATASELEGGQS